MAAKDRFPAHFCFSRLIYTYFDINMPILFPSAQNIFETTLDILLVILTCDEWAQAHFTTWQKAVARAKNWI